MNAVLIEVIKGIIIIAISSAHNFKMFLEENLKAEYENREVDKERDQELRNKAQKAGEEILKALDYGEIFLSNNALNILAEYQKESDKLDEYMMWHSYLESDFSITKRYMEKFKSEAKRDLKKMKHNKKKSN